MQIPTMKTVGDTKTKKPEEVSIIGGAKGAVEIEIKGEPIDFSHVKIEPIFEEMVDFETFLFFTCCTSDCNLPSSHSKGETVILSQEPLDENAGTRRRPLGFLHEDR